MAEEEGWIMSLEDDIYGPDITNWTARQLRPCMTCACSATCPDYHEGEHSGCDGHMTDQEFEDRMKRIQSMKRCKICNGEGVVKWYIGPDGKKYFIECGQCNRRSKDFSNRDDLIGQWNMGVLKNGKVGNKP